MTKHIHIHLHTRDAGTFKEGDHPRKAVVITSAGALHEIPASVTGGKMPKLGEPLSNYIKASSATKA